MTEARNPALEAVSDGTSGQVSLRDRLLLLSSNSGVRVLAWAALLGLFARQLGLPQDWLGLSGLTLAAGHWWTVFTWPFAAGYFMPTLVALFLLLASTPSVEGASVHENLRNGLRLVLVVMVCALVAGVVFLTVDGDRTTPVEGLLPAALGLLAYRMTRGFPAWRHRPPAASEDRFTAAMNALAVVMGSILIGDLMDWALRWPAFAGLVQIAGGPTLASLAIFALVFVTAFAWPSTSAWFVAPTILLVLVAKWAVVSDWLVNGSTPWAALLGGFLTGVLLGLFAPRLLPQGDPPETA